MTPKHKTTREEKIAFTLRMLDSDNNGDVIAVVHALKRQLRAMGADWDGLARGFTIKFVDDMASRTVYGREPNEKQHKYLHSLFYKLGGKLT
jgi:hypothetical protein